MKKKKKNGSFLLFLVKLYWLYSSIKSWVAVGEQVEVEIEKQKSEEGTRDFFEDGIRVFHENEKKKKEYIFLGKKGS